MNYTLFVRPPAIRATTEIHQYLEDQRTGLGSEFLSALRECFLFIQAHPKGAQIRKTPYRHLMVAGFRYRVVYAIVGRRVYVYQVRHTSRRPSKRFGP